MLCKTIRSYSIKAHSELKYAKPDFKVKFELHDFTLLSKLIALIIIRRIFFHLLCKMKMLVHLLNGVENIEE